MSQWGGKPAQKTNTEKNCPAVQVKSTRHTASENERQSHKAVKNDKNMQKYWPTKKRTSSDVGETGKRWVPAGQATTTLGPKQGELNSHYSLFSRIITPQPTSNSSFREGVSFTWCNSFCSTGRQSWPGGLVSLAWLLGLFLFLLFGFEQL